MPVASGVIVMLAESLDDQTGMTEPREEPAGLREREYWSVIPGSGWLSGMSVLLSVRWVGKGLYDKMRLIA
jgi:hypothetical protein